MCVIGYYIISLSRMPNTKTHMHIFINMYSYIHTIIQRDITYIKIKTNTYLLSLVRFDEQKIFARVWMF